MKRDRKSGGKSKKGAKVPTTLEKRFASEILKSSGVCALASVFFALTGYGLLENLTWKIDDPVYRLLRAFWREPAVGILTVVATLFVCICVILIFGIKRLISYIKAVIDAGQSLLMSDSAEIELPAPLSDVGEKMNALKQQALDSDRLAKEQEQKKNDLLVYLAHDLKTPLTSVIGYLTLVDDAPQLPEENKEKYTRIALQKAQRLEMLLNEFFDITRFSLHGIEIEKKRINLSILLYQMAEEFYPVYKERGLEIEVKAENAVIAAGDPDKIARVFDNLLKNAANYSYKDTKVEITVEQVGKNAVVNVKNRADEIPKESLEKLFDMFYRADSSRSASSGGAGVGLAVSKEIVELHGGTLSVTSDKEFTQFTVTLPRQKMFESA